MTAVIPLITLLALAIFTVTIGRVGFARVKYSVKAPATTGHDLFERHFRVQMNTLEQLVLFLPSLWMFALVWKNTDYIIGGLGALWLVGRAIYIASYLKDPATRTAGFGLAFAATLILYIGAFAGVVRFYLQAGHF